MMLRGMVACMRAAFQREQASSMVETALVLPAFFLLLFGIFSFSMALVSYSSATYCLRAAARYGSMHSLTSMSPVSAIYLSNLATSNMYLFSASSPVISVSYSTYIGAAPGNYVGNQLIMTVSWTQNVNIPFYASTFSVQTQTCRMVTQ